MFSMLLLCLVLLLLPSPAILILNVAQICGQFSTGVVRSSIKPFTHAGNWNELKSDLAAFIYISNLDAATALKVGWKYRPHTGWRFWLCLLVELNLRLGSPPACEQLFNMTTSWLSPNAKLLLNLMGHFKVSWIRIISHFICLYSEVQSPSPLSPSSAEATNFTSWSFSGPLSVSPKIHPHI